MIWWAWLLLALAATAELLAAAAGVEGQGPIGLANCTTKCGDVSVPYPFGIGSGRPDGVQSHLNTCYAPPRLFLGDGPLRVVDISLDNATMRVHGPQGYTDMSGSLSSNMSNGTINMSNSPPTGYRATPWPRPRSCQRTAPAGRLDLTCSPASYLRSTHAQ
ncbi:unnamed protein product [Urochloa humidicola]